MILLRWLRSVLELFFGLLILFEEWGWHPLKRAMARFMSLPIMAQISRKITALSPAWSLVVLLVPSVILVPIKLSALWLIHGGHAALGISLIVAAKLGGTALLAHLFHLTQPALMQISWFERFYGRWESWKNDLIFRIRMSWYFRLAKIFKRKIIRKLKKLAIF